MGLSNAKRRESGEAYKSRLTHAAKRAIILFCFGFFLSWISAGKTHFVPGVLQVLAFSYFGGFLFLGKSIKFQSGVFAALLFIYWFFIFMIPIPEAGRNSYVVYKNLVYFIDDIVTRTASRWEYLYTIITSIAVVVYGSIIGKFLVNRKSDKQFINTLAILGIVGIISGLALNPFIPIIKRMFTSSYTLFTCGLVSLIFLVFYWLIDVRNISKWSLQLIVIGMNSIFIYMLHNLLNKWFIDPLGIYIGAWVSPVKNFVSFLVQWLVCYWFYRRKIFFKL